MGNSRDMLQVDIEDPIRQGMCETYEDRLRRIYAVIVKLGNTRDLPPMERCAVLAEALAAIGRIAGE